MTETSVAQEIPPELRTLGSEDIFNFRCAKGLDCFTLCCRDISIVLTPYDVLRMKRALGLDSSAFLKKYTVAMSTRDRNLPVIILKMEGAERKCPFVSLSGCTIYPNRPWACRMYPLGLAESRTADTAAKFYFLLNEEFCHGHGKGKTCQLREWQAQQGLEEYDLLETPFRELMLHTSWEKAGTLTPEKMGMYFMACYDLDNFRRFVLESSFLRRFEMDETRIEAIRTDDEELLEFAVEWLRFALFGERTMKVRRDVSAQDGARPGSERAV